MPGDSEIRTSHNQKQLDYYESRKPAQNHRLAVVSSPYIYNQLDQVISVAGLSKDEAILDVGCGMGKYTIPLAERGYNVTGLELSPALLETLNKEASGRTEILTHQGDILDPDPKLWAQFDRIIGFFVLHHLIDIPAAFASLAKLLKPGGKLAILEPNPLCPLYYLQITFTPSMSWAAEKGMLSLKPKQTLDGLKAAGFEDIALHRFGILPPFLRNSTFGAPIEKAYDLIPILRPISAFQIICGTRP